MRCNCDCALSDGWCYRYVNVMIRASYHYPLNSTELDPIHMERIDIIIIELYIPKKRMDREEKEIERDRENHKLFT